MTPASAVRTLKHALEWAESHKQLVVKIDVDDAREIVQILVAASGSPVSSPSESADVTGAALDSGGTL